MIRALRLAWADLRREPGFALTTTLGLAAVVAPLILLAGLRAGVVAGLREDLGASPRAREIVNTVNRSLDDAWFAALRARPDVGFVVPRTRLLAATGSLEAAERPGSTVRVEIAGTAAGDPLLPGTASLQEADVVVAAGSAQRLGLSAGDAARLRVVRIVGGQRDVLNLDVRVAAIATAAAGTRDMVWADPRLGQRVQDFTDDRQGAGPRTHEGFRLYAARLEDVPVLDAALRAEGIEVASRAEEVQGLLGLDRSLTAAVAVIATVGGAGFVLGLATGLWASVERKRRTLALLRLMGLGRGTMIMMPVWQALLYAVAGTLAATLVAMAAAEVVNALEIVGPAGGRALARIGPLEVGVAAAATAVAATLAALLAARRVAAIDPAEGLRDG